MREKVSINSMKRLQLHPRVQLLSPVFKELLQNICQSGWKQYSTDALLTKQGYETGDGHFSKNLGAGQRGSLCVCMIFKFSVYKWLIYIDKFWRPHPSRSNFVYFHAVFRKFWPNNRLLLPFGVGALPPGKSCLRTNVFRVSSLSYNFIGKTELKHRKLKCFDDLLSFNLEFFITINQNKGHVIRVGIFA